MCFKARWNETFPEPFFYSNFVRPAAFARQLDLILNTCYNWLYKNKKTMEPLEQHVSAIESRIKILRDDPQVLDSEGVKKEILNYLLDDDNDFEI